MKKPYKILKIIYLFLKYFENKSIHFLNNINYKKNIRERHEYKKKNTQEMQIGINIHLIAITILPV